jgi:hypothetical protein
MLNGGRTSLGDWLGGRHACRNDKHVVFLGVLGAGILGAMNASADQLELARR